MTHNLVPIVVIDKHPFMRTALSTAFMAEEELRVIAEYTTSEEFYRDTKEIRPNVILVGIGTPGWAELESIRSLRSSFPTAILFALITGELEGQDKKALEHGADRVLLKTISRTELLSAVKKIN